MRRMLVALALLGLVSEAFAADYSPPVLRGSDAFLPATPTYFRWSGFYAGGQVTYGVGSADFSSATDPLTAFALRNTVLEGEVGVSSWNVLGTADTGAAGFGGFVGYNTQWDDVVLGLELNYTRSSLNITSPSNPLALNVTDSEGNFNVFSSGSASEKIVDFAVVRARAGWAFNNFLPYATAGLAVGRADLNVTSTLLVQNTIAPPLPNPVPACVLATCVITSSQNKTAAFLYGYAVGGGLEVALTRNIFARGEYEYIQWAPIWQITSHINITRLGVGLKF
jgi:outer membrane immunogenic protein